MVEGEADALLGALRAFQRWFDDTKELKSLEPDAYDLMDKLKQHTKRTQQTMRLASAVRAHVLERGRAPSEAASLASMRAVRTARKAAEAAEPNGDGDEPSNDAWPSKLLEDLAAHALELQQKSEVLFSVLQGATDPAQVAAFLRGAVAEYGLSLKAHALAHGVSTESTRGLVSGLVAQKQLAAKTMHQAEGILDSVKLALRSDPLVLRQELAELDYLEERIMSIQDKTVTRETWQEYAGAWYSLLQMRATMRSARAQAVLTRIFGDKQELKAIGAARQLEGMTGDDPPKVVIDLLKNNCAKPLQEAQYELSRALVREKHSIEKILGTQQQGVTLLWTVIVSTSIGLSNVMFPRILEAYGDGGVGYVVGGIALLALAAFLAARLARRCQRTGGVCAARPSWCAPCAKKEKQRKVSPKTAAGGGKQPQQVQFSELGGEIADLNTKLEQSN